MTRTLNPGNGQTEAVSEIDIRALGAALRRRSGLIALLTLSAFVLVAIFVTIATPRYTAETQVLLENQETFFTRPDRVNVASEMPSQFDPEAVASQIQLIGSRDIARRAIKDLHLEGNEEFDPGARGLGPLKRVLVAIGLMRDPTQESVDQRIVTAFLEKLVVYSPPKTRVISIQFSSHDPELAARGANLVASLYLKEQSAAKRATAQASADALAGQMTDLRVKLAAADADRERYRQQSGLLAGTNNMTISGQQVAEINTDLSKARTSQADAQAKASMIRELLRSGKAADVPDVLNNDIVRRVSDQRVTAQAQLALEARTLLPGHPRIKALQAQVGEYDLALKNAAKQAATTLENEAKIAGGRVANLEAVLSQQKKVAGVANGDEVRLRALDRTAQGYKDQLDSSTTKYQEALARESSTATPADARVISRAVTPQEPSYPKKLPFIAFGTIATLVFSVGLVLAAELLSGHVSIVETRSERDTWREPVQEPVMSRATPVTPTRAVPQTARSQVTELSHPHDADHYDDLAFAPVAPSHRTRAFGSHWFGASLTTLMSHALVAPIVARFHAFGQSAAASRGDADAMSDRTQRTIVSPKSGGRFGWDDESLEAPVAQTEAAPSDGDPDALAARIVAAHVPGRGLHIVGTSLGTETAAVGILIDLGRALADKGRSIIVDLNRNPTKLAGLARADGDGRAKIMGMSGLAELLAGDASFAEVIYRDHASRLHFIPTGRQDADFRDFDLILDALSETYDFIVMLTPSFPQSEIAKIMAPYADFIVLTAFSEPDHAMLAKMEAELIEAGAHEVLVAGIAPMKKSNARNVA